jgi:spore coat polysaccharide biosynthesis protein SpsF
MESQRLPKKVLLEICGKPIILHIVERLRKCKNISGIVLAIPDTAQNDTLKEFAEVIDCYCHRGSENDVLLRYYRAAEAFNVDTVVRITSDCPLVDPRLIDEMIEYYLNNTFDYLAVGIEGNYPRGLDAEVFSFETLKKVNIEAHLGYEREHVTPYIYSRYVFLKREGNLRDRTCDLQSIRKKTFSL